MADTWHAQDYSQFLSLRNRPAYDLLQAISSEFRPKNIIDLGCGPGNSTSLLKKRWPNADITGSDTSENMLTQARKTYPELSFEKEDICDFSPDKSYDLIFSNAALQWLSGHEVLLPKLASYLSEVGILAIQMPNNFHMPTHQTTIAVCKGNPSWQLLLKKLRYGKLTHPLYDANHYYNIFVRAKLNNILIWETTYAQVLTSHQAIFDWMKSTGLRPILSEMNEENKIAFEKSYIHALEKYYPVQSDNKVLLHFRRIFMIGHKNTSFACEEI